MKTSIVGLLCLLLGRSFGQVPHQESATPYLLQAPNDWGVERFPIPIAFAPEIEYTGLEDIRFAPGWADPRSEEYWSYAFLWCLDGLQKANAKTLEHHLKAYYTGLIAVNLATSNPEVSQAVRVKIKKVKPAKGDTRTFQGRIQLLDYMAKKPLSLQCIVHLKLDPKRHKTLLFFELSPNPFEEDIWNKLNRLWADFLLENRFESG